jgi:hypothetical protein
MTAMSRERSSRLLARPFGRLRERRQLRTRQLLVAGQPRDPLEELRGLLLSRPKTCLRSYAKPLKMLKMKTIRRSGFPAGLSFRLWLLLLRRSFAPCSICCSQRLRIGMGRFVQLLSRPS